MKIDEESISIEIVKDKITWTALKRTKEKEEEKNIKYLKRNDLIFMSIIIGLIIITSYFLSFAVLSTTLISIFLIENFPPSHQK